MNTIGILARPNLKEAGPAIAELVDWLRKRGKRACLEEATAALAGAKAGEGALVATGRDVAGLADALVVLGGDGTLLAASRLLEKPIPVLGVNFGSLGFLTEITLGELYGTLNGVLEGRYEHEERRLLRAVVARRGRPEVTVDVLNDVVITKAGPSRIIELDVSVGGVFVSSFRADGIIVSSPTGSTAYNLSAGGPIVHPGVDALVLTPIAPHTLTNRPVVLPASASLEIVVAGEVARSSREETYVTFDGQVGDILGPGETVSIHRAAYSLRLLKPSSHAYFQVLRQKLRWAER